MNQTRPNIPDRWPTVSKTIIPAAWAHNPKKRISAADAELKLRAALHHQ